MSAARSRTALLRTRCGSLRSRARHDRVVHLRAVIAGLLVVAAIAVIPSAATHADDAPSSKLHRGVSAQLEDTFAAVRTVASQKKPTIGDLFRRLRFLNRDGPRVIYPGLSWPETQERADIVLEGIEYHGCYRCATLVLRSNQPRNTDKKGPLRLAGAFLAGIDQRGNVLCVGPSDVAASRCTRAPWR